ncbi:MAG TPA: SDR family oxidoreductase [Kofleriaceae bacterium]|nr:SDR family oxidoreductase [Kofleriaceae bacterium]
MSSEILLVTGASGHLGRRVLDTLLARSPAPRLIATTRTPEALAAYAARGVEVRRADFDDPATLGPAFAGATRALLISTDVIDRPGRRITQHRNAVAALAASTVGHVVYTSLPRAPDSPVTIASDHAQTEHALAETSLDFTLLRNNVYADYLLLSLPGAVASGTLVDAKGGAGVAYVTRDDCARTAAGALAGRHGGRTTVDVTGPAAVTGADLAALATLISGKPVTYTSVPPAALVDGLVAHGVPRPIAELTASFDAAAARGDLATVTSAVRHYAGVEPTCVRAFLETQRAALRGA